jgi:hypothetical protein
MSKTIRDLINVYWKNGYTYTALAHPYTDNLSIFSISIQILDSSSRKRSVDILISALSVVSINEYEIPFERRNVCRRNESIESAEALFGNLYFFFFGKYEIHYF